MSDSRGMGSKQLAKRAVAALSVALGLSLAAQGRAGAQTGACVIQIDGVDASRAQSPRRPIRVDAGDEVLIRWRTGSVPRSARIDVELAFARATVLHVANPGRGPGEARVRVGEYAVFGVGLYRVVAITDGCTLEAWVRVGGRSPLSTVAGASAAVLLALGVLLAGAGLTLGHRRGRGLGAAMLGGLVGGPGALVLAQQFGLVALTETSVVAWTALPVAASGLVNRVAALAGSRAARRTAWHAGSRPGGGATAGSARDSSAAHSDYTVAVPGRRRPLPAEVAPPPRPPGEPWVAREEEPAEVAPAPGEPRVAREEEPAAVAPAARPDPREPRVAREGTPAAAAAAPGTGDGDRDPPRSAYARLECPEVAVAGQEIDVVAGLAPEPTPGVAGGPFTRPATSVGPYVLTVQVVADGFRLASEGDSWRREVPVTASAPYPSFTLRLAAEPQEEPVRARTIQAVYSVDGQTLGLAVRPVAVVSSLDVPELARPALREAGTDIRIPANRLAADLTARILRAESESEGRLLWTFETPHRGIDLPDAPVATDVGANPETFARLLVDRVGLHEQQAGLFLFLKGVGRTVADEMPAAFWEALRAVAGRTPGRPPTVLLLSEEPYVPWELAAVEPPLDPRAAPFLAAQATVGRWVLGQRRPKLPPPVEVRVGAIAVVCGSYDRQEWRLEQAEDEAATIARTFAAVPVQAEAAAVIACLQGVPRADVLHFAVHGVYNPTSPREGLVMVDGRTLDPLVVKGATLDGAPFVFLNACQVGSAAQVLGDYSGMAEAFLHAGASGVVAPLWSIDDAVAKDIALRFYRRTLVEGSPPAEVFRIERARFADSPEARSATSLAYVFFGHPSLRLMGDATVVRVESADPVDAVRPPG